MKKILSLVLALGMVMSLLLPSSVFAASAQQIKVTVNNKQVEFPDAQPIIKNGRTLVPLRGVFEQLGCNVDWEQSSKTASITLRGNTLKIKIGASLLNLNNKTLSQKLDQQAELISSRTYIPVRYAAESLGFSVAWDNSSKTVSVNGNGLSPSEAYRQAESIFMTIGTDKNSAGKYFKEHLNNVGDLKTSLNGLNAATKKADAIYTAGFMIIDCVNIGTSVSSALSEGGIAVYDAVVDAQKTMLDYVDPTEKLSASDYFTALSNGSYVNYVKNIEQLTKMHVKRIEKGYFTYSEATAYALTYWLLQTDQKTISTAVSLLLEDAPTGILSGLSLTAKKYTFNLLPNYLSESIQMLLELNDDNIRSYYSAINEYRGKMSALLK